jgi:hypothetical protein
MNADSKNLFIKCKIVIFLTALPFSAMYGFSHTFGSMKVGISHIQVAINPNIMDSRISVQSELRRIERNERIQQDTTLYIELELLNLSIVIEHHSVRRNPPGSCLHQLEVSYHR